MTTKQLSNKFTISKIFMLTLLLFTFTFAKTPQWIIKPPVNAAYYNGVGSAPMIEGNSDHIETARQAALSSIASQININIQSDVVSSIMENNDEIKENFERNIRTSTQASLEGYEIKDQYTSNGTFYTWIRLSKAKYQEIQAEKRKKAAELSLSFYREYENALENNNVATALNNAVRAIQSADAYIPDGLEYTLDGEEIYLVNHYYQSIQNLLDGIEIKPVQKVVKTKTGQALKNTAFIVTSNGNTIKNLPLLLSINGEGNDIPKSIRSDFSGKAVVRGAILHDSKKIQTLKASMELKGDKDSGAFLFPALLSQIQIPTGSIMLQVSGPVIYLTSDEQMNGTPVDMNRVEPAVKNMLTDAGFTFSNDLSAADFIMEIQVKAREGSQVSSLFTAFADMNLSITSIMDGSEIYKTSLKRVKGIDLSFEKAQIKALDAIADKIMKDKTEELIQALH